MASPALPRLAPACANHGNIVRAKIKEASADGGATSGFRSHAVRGFEMRARMALQEMPAVEAINHFASIRQALGILLVVAETEVAKLSPHPVSTLPMFRLERARGRTTGSPADSLGGIYTSYSTTSNAEK